MRNTANVFKELKEQQAAIIHQHFNNSADPSKEKVTVVVKFKNRKVEPARCEMRQLFSMLNSIFDGQHNCMEGKHPDTISSIYINDAKGNTFYNSDTYVPSPNKYNLKKDGDRKIPVFQSLSTTEKECAAENLAVEIENWDGDSSDSNSPEQSEDSPWGDEMPWS